MNPNAPHTYPRRILLMVTGRSPQVVTETLYALCVEQIPPFVPSEVQIITTSEGEQDARLSLLSQEPGWFNRLCRDYEITGVSFDADHIRILADPQGAPLSDIRTRDDNDCAADFIVEEVRRLTADDNCALHVSLAGGRKTMGYYLGYALSLYGRAQDRLSHVLVSSPFESNRDFFYPTPYSRVIYTVHAVPAEQRPLDAHDGRITLAEIPFVRLRNNLPSQFKGLSTGARRFSEVVTAAQRALEVPSVVVDYLAKGIRIADGTLVKLGDTDLSFYGWLARRHQLNSEPVHIPQKSIKDWTTQDRMEYEGYLNEYMQEANQLDLPINAGTELYATKAMTYGFFHQRKASIKERLEEDLGPLASRYEILALVAGRPAGYGLNIDPKWITFEE